jgi:hypothetical protein
MGSHASMKDTYDAFLFEPLGIEDSGMELSVLSALARAGLDPWAEAKRLAGLPRQAAVAAIAKLFNLGEDKETAKHLAELLPRSASSATASKPGNNPLLARQAFFRKYGLVMIAAGLVAVVGLMMYNDAAPAIPTPASVTATH